MEKSKLQLGTNGANLIKEFEGLKLKAYLCPAKVWTIGYGNTQYENGLSVKKGDVITLERANQLFYLVVSKFASGVKLRLKKEVNQNQFDALVSFAFNCGFGNLDKSTLLKKVNSNPNDETIRAEFMKWNKGGGKVLRGLTIRRTKEANLYFS